MFHTFWYLEAIAQIKLKQYVSKIPFGLVPWSVSQIEKQILGQTSSIWEVKTRM